jgi:hypothetical protein
MMHLSKQASAQDLAAVGHTRLSRQPLIVKCSGCGVEWRPAVVPAVKQVKAVWWQCRNGCNHPAWSKLNPNAVHTSQSFLKLGASDTNTRR